MVLLLTCVFVGKDTVFSYLSELASVKNGSWHAICYDVDSSQYKQMKELDYMDEVGTSIDYKFMDCKVSANHWKPFWEIKAYSQNVFDWMNISILEGRLPQKEDEIVISKTAIEDGGKIQIGDKIKGDFFTRSIKGINPKIESSIFPYSHITIHYGETVEVDQNFPYYGFNEDIEEIHKQTGMSGEYTVVGIVDTPSIELEEGSFYSAFTCCPEGKSVFDISDTTNIFCRFQLNHIPANYGYMDDLEKIIGEADNSGDRIDVNDILLIFAGNSSEDSMNIIVTFVMTFFVVLISGISIILIYNVFHISYEERKKYLGMLSSIGATSRQRKSSVYYEAFLLLSLSLPIGIISGLAVVKLGMDIIDPYIQRMMATMLDGEVIACNASLCISMINMLLIILMAIVTVFLAAYFPAKKIGKYSPIESIRGNEDNHKKSVKRMGTFFVKNPIFSLALKNIKTKKGRQEVLSVRFLFLWSFLRLRALGQLQLQEWYITDW